MITSRRSCILLAAATAFWAAGCGCLSAQQADAEQERLHAFNRDRAELAMRAAAESRGAVLLPVEAKLIDLPGDCEGAGSEPEPLLESDVCGANARQTDSCASWAVDRRSLVIRHKGQSSNLIVAVGTGWQYARLARRGNALVVLEPQISLRTVGNATQCECDGMPRVICPTVYGFVTDDVAAPQIERVSVPMTVDGPHWSCKALLL